MTADAPQVVAVAPARALHVSLVGLDANMLFGWAWTDPIAALVIAAVALKEGRDGWRGEPAALPYQPLTTQLLTKAAVS